MRKHSNTTGWVLHIALATTLCFGCTDDPETPVVDPTDPTQVDLADPTEVSDPSDLTGACIGEAEAELPANHVAVCVLVDDVATQGVVVMQGGALRGYPTDATGRVQVPVEGLGERELVMTASHFESRIQFVSVSESYSGQELMFRLTRFATGDNRRYSFQDPGSPGNSPTTGQCGHCHISIVADWYTSVHRDSASNPWVQNLYSGTAAHFSSQLSCEEAGGRWRQGLQPGSRESVSRCYLGTGALPTLNENCGETVACDEVATEFGACADCHAPGINGALGGRDLLVATDIAYADGVHCDVCHRVNRVNLESELPGVAGRLELLRPSEVPSSVALGEFLPLTFGPRHDVPNPRMGGVFREHYTNGELCAGCHEYEQAVLVPGASIDLSRWPNGRLPVHSTWSEWESGPLGGTVPCNNCHMPPNAAVENSIDIQDNDILDEGVAAGFNRAPGTTKHHHWVGPRFTGQRMLQLAAALQIEKSVDEGVLTAQVTVKHVGPGHAIPTGEPMRSMVLRVRALCANEELMPAGGHVVPDFGGYEELREAGQDWQSWPQAAVGDELRVVMRTSGFHDYSGFGPFGDGTFSASQKGMPVEIWEGTSTVLAIDAEGSLVLNQPLPAGSRVYRIRRSVSGEASQAAGSPGFAFARVMVDAQGNRMVPHYAAVDVASDNRLLPFDAFTTSHAFVSTCANPVIKAVLLYRSFPHSISAEKKTLWTESVMQEVTQ